MSAAPAPRTPGVLLPGVAPGGPERTLGVVGGGQLGRMFVQAAQALGFFTAVLDPDPLSLAGRIAHYHVRAAYDDLEGIARLAGLCDAVTTEFENVPAATLAALAAARPVAPAADAVAIAQDRIAEKAHFTRCGVPCAPYAVIASAADCAAADPALFPGILKTARLGYDGKGQAVVETPAGLAAAWGRLGGVACVLEQRLALAGECSVIVARGAGGAMVSLPVQRNLHRGGILAVTEIHEGNVPQAQAQSALLATKKIAEGLDYRGVLCVEFFLLADGALVVNEMAPRPHNSGHYSIDACDCSQFELQVRALAGLPLVAPRQHSAAVMLNLLGELWQHGTPPWDAVLALPGAHLHLYGKAEAERGRKMGHLTFTAATADAARAAALRACAILGIAPFGEPARDGGTP